jgi:hypothetical protein
MRPATRVALALTVLAFAVPRKVLAHCDTMGGPVVTMAKAALKVMSERQVGGDFRRGDQGGRTAFARTFRVLTPCHQS